MTMIAPPTSLDIIAARRILDAGDRTHPKVRDLTGAKLCIHPLAGSGQALDSVVLTTMSEAARDSWRMEPYRHHAYTPDPSVRRSNGMNMLPCLCGNYEQNPSHLQCWTEMGIEIRTDAKGRQLPPWEQPEAREAMGYARLKRPKRVTPADREAAARMLNLVDDPQAHGRHKPNARGRVVCGRRQYKDHFAPCQIVETIDWTIDR